MHMHVYKHKHTLTHSHLERKRGPLMPGLGLHIQRACKEKSSHPALTLTPLSREKDRGVSGVSLLKGSGNFHSRVLLKLPRFTLLKPVLTNLLQNPNFVLIPPSLSHPPLPDPSSPCMSFLKTYLPLHSGGECGARLLLFVSVCGWRDQQSRIVFNCKPASIG